MRYEPWVSTLSLVVLIEMIIQVQKIYHIYVHIWYHIYLILTMCIRQCWRIRQQEPRLAMLFRASSLWLEAFQLPNTQRVHGWTLGRSLVHFSNNTRGPKLRQLASTCHPESCLASWLNRDDHPIPMERDVTINFSVWTNAASSSRPCLPVRIASPPRLLGIIRYNAVARKR